MRKRRRESMQKRRRKSKRKSMRRRRRKSKRRRRRKGKQPSPTKAIHVRDRAGPTGEEEKRGGGRNRRKRATFATEPGNGNRRKAGAGPTADVRAEGLAREPEFALSRESLRCGSVGARARIPAGPAVGPAENGGLGLCGSARA